jgi:hypothetical protein
VQGPLGRLTAVDSNNDWSHAFRMRRRWTTEQCLRSHR